MNWLKQTFYYLTCIKRFNHSPHFKTKHHVFWGIHHHSKIHNPLSNLIQNYDATLCGALHLFKPRDHTLFLSLLNTASFQSPFFFSLRTLYTYVLFFSINMYITRHDFTMAVFSTEWMRNSQLIKIIVWDLVCRRIYTADGSNISGSVRFGTEKGAGCGEKSAEMRETSTVQRSTFLFLSLHVLESSALKEKKANDHVEVYSIYSKFCFSF